MTKNRLYYGDNLDVLRRYVATFKKAPKADMVREKPARFGFDDA